MAMKGVYNESTSYSVGDVVQLDGLWYILAKSASSGTPPTNPDYWDPKDPTQDDILDMIGELYAMITGLNPNAKELVLASSSASSTKKFKITVIDNGTVAGTEIT